MTSDPADLLLATPLFADVDKKLLEGVRKECAITAGTFEWQPGVARRDGFVRFVDLRDGEVVVGQGDLATAFVVVLQGSIRAVQARPGHPPREHRTYGAGEWFGEVSAHSHHPALATYTAREPSRVALLDERVFAKLYAEDEEWQTRIDDGYRDNLPLHLGASRLCRSLDDQALAGLAAAAELRTFDADEDLAAAGDPADTVFLVRAGAIACLPDADRPDRVLAYYKGNATFGEHSIAGDAATWPATYRALCRTSVVALPRAAFARLDAAAQRGLQRAANRAVGAGDVAAANDAAPGELAARRQLEELFVMVERESVKGGRALVIDRAKCVRCNMCVESCVAVHDDHVPRLSKVGTPVANDVLVTACYHCEVPQCMLSCDYAAIRRDPQGRVRFEYDNCVGCAGCIDGCPYGVIRLVEPTPPPAPPPSFLQSLPLIGRWFGTPAPAAMAAPAAPAAGGEKPRSAGVGGKLTPVAGKTIKCDLCAGLPFEACVYNCPTTAIVRREPQSLFEPRRS